MILSSVVLYVVCSDDVEKCSILEIELVWFLIEIEYFIYIRDSRLLEVKIFRFYFLVVFLRFEHRYVWGLGLNDG